MAGGFLIEQTEMFQDHETFHLEELMNGFLTHRLTDQDRYYPLGLNIVT